MPYTSEGLPFAPRSHTSYKAAIQAEPSRASKTAKYLKLLTVRACSDHEAAEALGLPLSSICSIRNGCKNQLVKAGTTISLYGRSVDRWRLA